MELRHSTIEQLKTYLQVIKILHRNEIFLSITSKSNEDIFQNLYDSVKNLVDIYNEMDKSNDIKSFLQDYNCLYRIAQNSNVFWYAFDGRTEIRSDSDCFISLDIDDYLRIKLLHCFSKDETYNLNVYSLSDIAGDVEMILQNEYGIIV